MYQDLKSLPRGAYYCLRRQEPCRPLGVEAMILCRTDFSVFQWEKKNRVCTEFRLSLAKWGGTLRHFADTGNLQTRSPPFSRHFGKGLKISWVIASVLYFTLQVEMWFRFSLSPIKPISSGFCSGFNLTLFHLAFYGLVTIFQLCYTTKWLCGETKKALFFLNNSVRERLCLPNQRSVCCWIL